jgi:hypothetical protein
MSLCSRLPRLHALLVKAKAHRGEPLNERADTQAENARQLPSECRHWTTRTQRMTCEWNDNDGVKHVTAWAKAVRNAMIRGGAEFQRQKALNQAENNWKAFLGSTDTRLHRIGQTARTGAQSDFMDSTRWGWSCMLQLQGADNWETPADTTWAAEFLLKDGESREFLGSWINSSAVHEAKKRRAKQVITCSFPVMREVAAHDWSSYESGVRTLQKGEKHGPKNDRCPPNRNTSAHSKCRV